MIFLCNDIVWILMFINENLEHFHVASNSRYLHVSFVHVTIFAFRWFSNPLFFFTLFERWLKNGEQKKTAERKYRIEMNSNIKKNSNSFAWKKHSF